MAQTALAIQMDQVVGVSLLTEEEAVQIAMQMLKNYRKLDKEIAARERRAKASGKGFLTKYQKQLALVGKSHAYRAAGHDIMYKEKAERFFGESEKFARGKQRFNDAAAFRELQDLMIGTTAWGGNDAEGADWKGKIVTFDREAELYDEEMKDLLEEKDYVLDTLKRMEEYDKRGFDILFCQYVKGMKVTEVIVHLNLGNIADSTYHHWRKAALKLFAELAGLC